MAAATATTLQKQRGPEMQATFVQSSVAGDFLAVERGSGDLRAVVRVAGELRAVEGPGFGRHHRDRPWRGAGALSLAFFFYYRLRY